MIAEYEYNPVSPASIVGQLETGATAFIEVWDGNEPVAVAASGVTEIGSTGKYAWSTVHVPPLTKPRQQFHWRMTGGASSDEGDFILRIMPHAVVLPPVGDCVIDPRVLQTGVYPTFPAQGGGPSGEQGGGQQPEQPQPLEVLGVTQVMGDGIWECGYLYEVSFTGPVKVAAWEGGDTDGGLLGLNDESSAEASFWAPHADTAKMYLGYTQLLSRYEFTEAWAVSGATQPIVFPASGSISNFPMVGVEQVSEVLPGANYDGYPYDVVFSAPIVVHSAESGGSAAGLVGYTSTGSGVQVSGWLEGGANTLRVVFPAQIATYVIGAPITCVTMVSGNLSLPQSGAAIPLPVSLQTAVYVSDDAEYGGAIYELTFDGPVQIASYPGDGSVDNAIVGYLDPAPASPVPAYNWSAVSGSNAKMRVTFEQPVHLVEVMSGAVAASNLLPASGAPVLRKIEGVLFRGDLSNGEDTFVYDIGFDGPVSLQPQGGTAFSFQIAGWDGSSWGLPMTNWTRLSEAPGATNWVRATFDWTPIAIKITAGDGPVLNLDDQVYVLQPNAIEYAEWSGEIVMFYPTFPIRQKNFDPPPGGYDPDIYVELMGEGEGTRYYADSLQVDMFGGTWGQFSTPTSPQLAVGRLLVGDAHGQTWFMESADNIIHPFIEQQLFEPMEVPA